MNGDQSLFNEETTKFDKYISEYEERIGLPKNTKPCDEDEMKKYFSMDKVDIDGLSAEECTGIAVRLAQYELFLQRTVNTETNHVAWCKHQLDKEVAKIIKEFSGGSWETQRQRAINSSDYMLHMQKVLLHAEGRLTSIKGITFSIKNLIDQINNVRYIKYSKKTQVSS